MKLFYSIFFFILISFVSPKSYGQVENTKVATDTVPTLEFAAQEEVIPTKKKKVKKKVFYGLKCKRGFAAKGEGERMVIESFYFLKAYKEPNPYVKKVYVYDVRKQQIVELAEINKKDVQFYKILHGPYKKTQNGAIIEEGIYYVGTKHGRWERYAPQRKEVFYNGEKGADDDEEDKAKKKTEIEYSILLDKDKYYRGWPKESRITFYDGAHTKIKEVLPLEHGRMNGDYYYFKENGEILIQGKYIDGKKAGIWVEWHPSKKQKKKETKYPKSPYDEDQFEPLVLSEWDENGQLTVQNGQAVEVGKKGTDPLKEKFKRSKGGKKK